MFADNSATVLPSLRQRRRAAATREIVDAAERHVTEHGPHALSLRAVARELGMTVQGLYHYFPNRDALVTALVTKAYDDLADAVTAAVDAAAGEPAGRRFVAATEGYRHWAVTHVERFQLLYGAPLRHYEAPAEGPTTQAMRRMGNLPARTVRRVHHGTTRRGRHPGALAGRGDAPGTAGPPRPGDPAASRDGPPPGRLGAHARHGRPGGLRAHLLRRRPPGGDLPHGHARPSGGPPQAHPRPTPAMTTGPSRASAR